jgi:acyl dehydratase
MHSDALSKWDEYIEGMHFRWSFCISPHQMQLFADLSQDFNPVHLDKNYARGKGFQAPIVYGLLLCSQMSRLIGQEMPDKNALLTGIKMDFISPCYPGEELFFCADLVNKSESTRSMQFKCRILREGITVCRGSVSAIWRL